jgi:hypothetical protein
LYILFVLFSTTDEKTRFWTEWQQTLPEFNLLLISYRIKFCFVIVGKLSDRCLTMRTLLHVSFKHILINLTFHGYTKLYENIVQYFPPLWIIGFLEVYE